MIKPRSLKKGESPTWKVGRKSTGLKRNSRLSIRLSEEELEEVNEIFSKVSSKKTDAFLLIMRKYSEKLIKNKGEKTMKNKIFENYNLYLNEGAEQFKIESLEEFERHVKLELKDFAGKEDLNLKPASIEEFEEVIKNINENNKNKVSFFLIPKEDDEQ